MKQSALLLTSLPATVQLVTAIWGGLHSECPSAQLIVSYLAVLLLFQILFVLFFNLFLRIFLCLFVVLFVFFVCLLLFWGVTFCIICRYIC